MATISKDESSTTAMLGRAAKKKVVFYKKGKINKKLTKTMIQNDPDILHKRGTKAPRRELVWKVDAKSHVVWRPLSVKLVLSGESQVNAGDQTKKKRIYVWHVSSYIPSHYSALPGQNNKKNTYGKTTLVVHSSILYVNCSYVVTNLFQTNCIENSSFYIGYSII